jgi:hypothetical protein
MKKVLVVFFLLLLLFPNVVNGATKVVDWNWTNYSNSALLSEGGGYTLDWYWWFNSNRRPVGKAYLLMNHKESGWVSTTSNCAFNPNGVLGQKFVTIKKGITYEYYVFLRATLVAPLSVPGGTVIAQTKGPKITGGVELCGTRYFPPGVPIKIVIP